MNGLGILISIGKWGGIYYHKGWMFRLCIGWIAITLIPKDGDDFLEEAIDLLEQQYVESEVA